MDQDVGVGRQLTGLGKCRKRGSRLNGGFEYGRRLEIDSRSRQRRQLVVGDVAPPGRTADLPTHFRDVSIIKRRFNTLRACVRVRDTSHRSAIASAGAEGNARVRRANDVMGGPHFRDAG